MTHPMPQTLPIPCGKTLERCSEDRAEIADLLEAGSRFRSFKYWDKIRVGRSEVDITGQGFNAVKFDPAKPARTIRKNDGQVGMHGAMHWSARRRFTVAEFKRFASFPDGFAFQPRHYEHAVGQIGNCVPPLFMRAIAASVRSAIDAARD
jgi:DNA (cytosine-5)-methyltransferase 1